VDVDWRQDRSVAYLTINRPQALNALNRAVLGRIEEIFLGLERSAEIRTVVITGAGEKAFVAGADVVEIQEAGERRPELIEDGKRILGMIGRSAKVVIAAVNGYALGGGCELALFCDVRIASENARFGFPEAKLGLMPGYGGTQLLPRLIGPARAKYLMLSGEVIPAETAFQFGLVDKICPRETLVEEVGKLATAISANGPLSLKAIKAAVDGGAGLPLPDAMSLESEQYRKVARSQDAEAGIAAFLEKRPPTFQGK
jgi:enoyl-CoA hydratase